MRSTDANYLISTELNRYSRKIQRFAALKRFWVSLFFVLLFHCWSQLIVLLMLLFFLRCLYDFRQKFFFSVLCTSANASHKHTQTTKMTITQTFSGIRLHSSSTFFGSFSFSLSLFFETITTQISFVWKIKKLLEWHFSYLSFSFGVTLAATVKYAYCIVCMHRMAFYSNETIEYSKQMRWIVKRNVLRSKCLFYSIHLLL